MKRIGQELLSALACLVVIAVAWGGMVAAQGVPPAKQILKENEPPSLPVQTTPLPVKSPDAKPEATPALTPGAQAEIWRINSQLNELNTELLQLRARGADLSAKMRDAVDRGMKESKIDPEKWDVRIIVDQRTQEQTLVVQAKPKTPAAPKN